MIRDELTRLVWFVRAVIADWQYREWRTWHHVVWTWRYCHEPLLWVADDLDEWFDDELPSDPYEEFA